MRLLIINPNTTSSMTGKVALAARQALGDAVEIVTATGRFGADYVASRASFAIAGHAALDAFAEHGRACDAVLLACFGDPGLEALREVSTVPVISLIDAACAEAAAGGRRFSIVTGGTRWHAMLTEMIAARGLGGQLASIRTVAPTGGDIARDPQGSAALLARTCQLCADEDGAGAVILGGAGLIGLAGMIQPGLKVAVICSNAAGFRATAAALGARLPAITATTDPVGSTGLSPALTALLKAGRL